MKTICSMILLTASCAAITTATAAAKPHRPLSIKKQFSVRPFNNIHINGGVNVRLRYAPSSSPRVQEAGRGIQALRVSVHQNTLTLKAPSGKLQSSLPQVTLTLTQPLHSLTVQGIADVSARDLRSKNLNILLKGPGHIALSGRLNTKQVWQTGGGYVELTGVRGGDISIKLSELATTSLKGRVKMLTARLSNSSTLEAKKLRANTVFVKTAGNALARVFPVQSLRAFASGQSQVFYYHTPKFVTENTSKSGNVLQMGWGKHK